MELRNVTDGQIHIILEPADTAQLSALCHLVDELGFEFPEHQDMIALARNYGATFQALTIAAVASAYVAPDSSETLRHELTGLGIDYAP